MERTITTNSNITEAPKKQILRVQIPYTIRFGLIWTIVFAIIGIVIQSVKADGFVFVEFFASNYLSWFKAFGTFTDQTLYPTAMDFLLALLKHWYYFFYTGGLISLIWGIVSWLVHLEIVFKKKEKIPTIEPVPRSTPVKNLELPKIMSISEQEHLQEQQEKIEEWLEEGLRILAEGNIDEAELIYNGIRQEYNLDADPGRKNYRRILDFYMELVEERRERDKRMKK